MITRTTRHRRLAASAAAAIAATALLAPITMAQPLITGQQPDNQPGSPIRMRGFIPPVMSMHREADEVKLDSGVRYVTLIPGSGTEIVKGSYIGFEFNVFTPKGELIYTSRQPGNKPAGVKIPGGELWPAWEQAMMGMKRGELRKILIPKEAGPGPKGLGPLPGDTDLVIEVGLFSVAPPIPSDQAQRGADGSTWMDLVEGEGDQFDKSGFANCHLNVYNDNGELMGSTTIERFPIQVTGDADRYWVKYAMGMKRGGSRVIEFDEPQAYRQMRLQEAGLNPVDPKKVHKWRMVIDCLSVTPPIVKPEFDLAKAVDVGNGVKIVDVVVGEGEPFPPKNKPDEDPKEWTPTIQYSSWFADDGTLFDSSHKPGGGPVPYSAGLYPSVWQRGLKGMRKGGKRLMMVPPNIDKGQDFRQVPDDHPFLYEIELLDWEEAIFTLEPNGLDFSEQSFELGGEKSDQPKTDDKPADKDKK